MTEGENQAGVSNDELMILADWQQVLPPGDITYHKAEGIARIAFNRPEIRNAFRPKTIDEMTAALLDAWHDSAIGVVWLTANGPSPKDGVWFLLCRWRPEGAGQGRLCRR